jgi:two-component system NarL family sensor kinase
LGRTYQNQSFLYTTAGRYQQSLSSLDTAVLNYQKSDHPKAKLWEANAYGDIANALRSQNEFREAVAYYLKSISILEEMELMDKLVNVYCNISTIFGDLDEFGKQIEYAHKGLDAAKKSGQRQSIFSAFFILANSYNMQGDGKMAKVFVDSSSKYFNEEENIDNIDMRFSYYLVAGQVFKKLNRMDSAFYFFRKGLDVSNEYNYSYGKAAAQLELGAIAIMKKEYPDAEKYLLSGIEEAKALNIFGILNDGYKYLSDVYAVTGRYKEAYEFYQKHTEINDSSTSIASKKYATELEKKYESAKKDKQISQQQSQLVQRRAWNYVLVSSVVGLAIISLLSYRNYRQKQKLQQQQIGELEKARQLNATEAVLKGEEQERTRLARDLHDGLGGMMSGIKYSFQTMKKDLIMTAANQQAFERGMDMLDSSISEMRRVAHNMMPEALVKFGLDTALKDFCNDINGTGSLQVIYQSMGIDDIIIEQSTSITIYRVVQELINNIMKHASAKSAIVQLTRANHTIAITVEDDGKGFNPSILEGARGIGWSNIQSRIEYLKGEVDVQSQPGKGTSVHIEFNL